MKKRIIIISFTIILSLVIIGIYSTFASEETMVSENTYDIVLDDNDGELTIPAGSSKTIIYKVTNTNRGKVKYGVTYLSDNISVKVYSDSSDEVNGYIDYGETKFIKLYIENSSNEEGNVSIKTALGYENGGKLEGTNAVSTGYDFINYEYPGRLYDYITDLYNSSNKTVVTNNEVEYNYASDVSLMNDRNGGTTSSLDGGNIRYYGSNPNNYIYFNCSDYSNQSESTCELWRIIGIVDGKVKLIRGKSIGKYSWDYTSTGEFDNNWNDATLNTLLNDTYYNSGSSLYYNWSETGFTVDFSTGGITKATRSNNLISKSIWYINKMQSSEIYSNMSYAGERIGGKIWTGNIGLLYPSDYGYATDLSSCKSSLFNYDTEECSSKNWMTLQFSTEDMGYHWLMTPLSYPTDADFTGVWDIINGKVYSYWNDSCVVVEVEPVLYLDPELKIDIETNGSIEKPYKLIVG